jgi:DNA-binding transcriptional ArsR family regulator
MCNHSVAHGGIPLIGDLQHFKADYLKAMAHPIRIRALEVLRQGEMGVAELQGQVDPQVANMSQHLSVLRSVGIVAARKAGPSVLYSVRDAEVFTILDALREIFGHRLHSMQTMLAAEDGRPEPVPPSAPEADHGGSMRRRHRRG